MDLSNDHPAQPAVPLLRNRSFILLWFAYAVSAMGDHISEMAILKTQNALDPNVDVTPLMARMTFTFFVPFFLLATVAGSLADRLPRKSLMITADLVRCVIMLGFASLIACMPRSSTWGPFLPLLAVGAFACLFAPARSALLPTLIRPDQLIRANGLISGLGIISTMIAAGISGHLADHYPARYSFRIDAATFAASALFLAFIRSPRLMNPGGRSAAKRADEAGLLSGFRYALGHRRVLELLAVAGLIWFCGALVNSVIPAVVRDVYGGTYQQMSGFRVFLGVGFILGAIVISLLGNALRSEIAITWGFFGVGVAIAVFAASVFLPLAPSSLSTIGAAAIILAGLFAVGVMASFNALLQRIVPDRHRGRVFGAKEVCCTGALLAATGLLGVPRWTHIDRWVGYILLCVAAITVGAGVVTLRVRMQRSTHPPGLMMLGHLNEFVVRLLWRFRRIGVSTVPRSGPAVIASNHVSGPDPALLCAAVPYRRISFLIAAEYARRPWVRFLVRRLECIPVKRGTRDVHSTKQALRHLKAGQVLGIFIEGGILPPDEPRRPKDGVAMLAMRTGAVVIPAFISGTRYKDGIVASLLTRHNARVRLGKPIDLGHCGAEKPDRESLRLATERIYTAIQALQPESGSDPYESRRHWRTSAHES